MRQVTVRLVIRFDDLLAESGDDALEAIKQAIVQMHDHCQAEFEQALAQIGARDVKLEATAY